MTDHRKREFIESWMREQSIATRSSRDSKLENIPELERSAPPVLIPFADMDYWYLGSALQWRQPNGKIVSVPKGFTTDFASVPRAFWSWMPPTGRYGLPALVHDWHYWDQGVDRQAADQFFEDNLANAGVNAWWRWPMMRAVRWKGGRHWNANTAAKKRGDGRVLKVFPDEASITWEAWRKRSDVFADVAAPSPFTVPAT